MNEQRDCLSVPTFSDKNAKIYLYIAIVTQTLCLKKETRYPHFMF